MQVVSSWWVPFEIQWVYDAGRDDFGISEEMIHWTGLSLAWTPPKLKIEMSLNSTLIIMYFAFKNPCFCDFEASSILLN